MRQSRLTLRKIKREKWTIKCNGKKIGSRPTILLEILNSVEAAAVRHVLLCFFFFQHVIVSQLSLRTPQYFTKYTSCFILLASLLGHLQSAVLFNAERMFVKHSSSSDSK